MHQVKGYGPSLRDQGVGPEDCEEPKAPVGASVILYQELSCFDKEGKGHEYGPLDLILKKRFKIEDLSKFEKDLWRFAENGLKIHTTSGACGSLDISLRMWSR